MIDITCTAELLDGRRRRQASGAVVRCKDDLAAFFGWHGKAQGTPKRAMYGEDREDVELPLWEGSGGAVCCGFYFIFD